MEDMKSTTKIVIVVIAVALAVLLYKAGTGVKTVSVTNFSECAARGNPVMESYPRRCQYGGQTFTEDIGNILDKMDLIRLNSVSPNSVVQSPLVVSGEARGYWYFEASFPVVLLDGNENEIAVGIAQAKGEWMTENFVPFEAMLTFTKPATTKGTLILKKDNPSGLPENEDELRIPVTF
ncbi:MAG: hypothetical protein A2741_02105 [Candidatus Zambryskibacteria bacterium RIFCSPHIGHO2_01_FULL_43_27]|uniref:Bacterial spore germination immunoglobulin-like domain-containing protein n=1 Tax=Candidatus Zambryskibacteria bacterium RIFCSPLOWO2_01_FULL_43_17 TaxID=1802760 RepID=A0A1G2U1E0_9BACT|nr:MAG: hypothetical protein A2741_02105 [Candidatus Zambryskibacteria bacterium RIFCSPHIGHO2_01_FULL_43_27]OHA99767.1 MAG: hypothetical protein A3E93_00835 [Candidatus Zambryskibacteria bacterium RIFCSPHIGHO2_12_FULL_43_12b]OHB03229.1 MAG: hypothetical protein A2920_02585 [Candidatus Zambryskibacteria bacterium RIFCSPLOWO2_01_FULL_43_17]